MSWIDDINKKLEEQRQALRDAKESGETLSRIKSHSASFVSQETHSKAGKIGGKKNVESGHLEKLRTKEHQSKAGTHGGLKRVKNLNDANFFGSEKHKNMSSKGGKTSGKNNVESGHWAKCQEKSRVSVKKLVKCDVCGDVGGNSAMKGHHFDKCKTLELFDALPDSFRLKDAKVICDQIGVHSIRINRDTKRYKSENRMYYKIHENRINTDDLEKSNRQT